jgi:biopolymer transport protein ExbD
MRIRCKDDGDQPEVNMTPIIDMVFLLLIFFLVATKFADIERDVRVHPPASRNARAITDIPSEIIINISRDGDFRIAGQSRSLSDIDQLLARAGREQARQSVVIRGDKDTILQFAVNILDLSEKHGVERTYLTTSQANP